MNPAEFQTLARAERSLWWFRGMQRMLFGLLDPLHARHRISRVLEAGCGTGYTAGLLQQRYGWRVFAVDLAWEGISRAARSGEIVPIQADISCAPFRAESFDAVLALDVLIHFPRGEEAAPLAEFARLLKPEGLLVLRVSALDVLRSRHSEFTQERQRFTRSRLVRTALEQGFRVLRCTYANSLLLPVALARFRMWEPLTGARPASGTAPVPRWLDRMLYAPLALEAAFLARGWNLPAGQSLILIAAKA